MEARLFDVQLLMEGDLPERQFFTRLTVNPAMFEIYREGELVKRGGVNKVLPLSPSFLLATC